MTNRATQVSETAERVGAFAAAMDNGFEGTNIGKIMDRIEELRPVPELADWFSDGGEPSEDDFEAIEDEAREVEAARRATREALHLLADAIRAEADKL